MKNDLPALMQRFFTERLLTELHASPHTIAAYRDTFRLLLRHAAKKLGVAPTELSLEYVDATFIGNFLDHLEHERGNGARTRNARLAAIRSFFRYVAINEPAYGLHCQRVLSMARKKYARRPVAFLDYDESEALLTAPDQSTWVGRRDHALLSLTIQTGLRVSELVNLRTEDVVLGRGAHVRCQGKGRKERCTPLRPDVIAAIKSWLRERGGAPDGPLFPTALGTKLSRDAVERLVGKHTETAGKRCASLRRKHVSPHVLRHTAAMRLLQDGADRTVIALWLGHESVETTQIYLQADLRMKERALARTTPSKSKPGRFRPSDKLLAFLEGL